MFHHIEVEASTGEPPTAPSAPLHESAPVLSAEPDSGYEASPSSTNEQCTFCFERGSLGPEEHPESEMNDAADSTSAAVSEEELEPRPSSLPIPIPGVTFDRPASRRPSPPGTHPLSWPSALPPGRPRTRRLLLDADVWLAFSSDEEAEVFVMERNSSREPAWLSNGAIPSSGRTRSVSVNLPLEPEMAQAVVAVGRGLRRLSDHFHAQVRVRRRASRQQFQVSRNEGATSNAVNAVGRNGRSILDDSDDSEEDPHLGRDRSS